MTNVMNSLASTPALAVVELTEIALLAQDDRRAARNSQAGDIQRVDSDPDPRLWRRSKPCLR